MNFHNKTILVTGGTGSFGKSLVDQIIKKNKNIKKLIIFSRDELKQFNLSKQYNAKKYKFNFWWYKKYIFFIKLHNISNKNKNRTFQIRTKRVQNQKFARILFKN